MDGHEAGGIDTTRPHSARVYNALMGGKDNFEVDRAVAEGIVAQMPALPALIREHRGTMVRVVRWLRGEGVGQFLDIGTGLPGPEPLHEAADGANVVYVDNDPLVLAHARALLTAPATWYVHADMREPEALLRQAGEHLDFSAPVALLIIGTLHHIDQPEPILAPLIDALAPGSYVVLQNVTGDVFPEDMGAVSASVSQSGIPYILRSKDEFARFFTGLELIEPGVVAEHRWRPAGPTRPDSDAYAWFAVARKP
jgi:SAM-dependent methyltransferase